MYLAYFAGKKFSQSVIWIKNEKRLTDMGKPVEWDFIFFSNDEFAWRQTDWPEGGYTEPLFRCVEPRALLHRDANVEKIAVSLFTLIAPVRGTIPKMIDVRARNELL